MFKRAYLAVGAVAAGVALAGLVSLPAAATQTQTLAAGLVSGTDATFGFGGTSAITCSTSTIDLKVTTTNVSQTVSVTSLPFSNCTTNLTGVTGVTSVTATGLPWSGPVSDGIVTLESAGTTGITIVLKTVLGQPTCEYSASSVTGSGTFDAGGGVTFTNDSFTLFSGPGTCPSDLSFSAEYGPFATAST